MKMIAVAVLSVAVFVGCDKQSAQQKTDEKNKIVSLSENDKLVKWSNGRPLLNLIVLHQYYRRHETGEYPMGKNQSRETLARAIELAIDKEYELKPDFKISVNARGTVPVKITVNGDKVPLQESDFKPVELEIARVAVQAAIASGETTKDVPPFFLPR